MATRLVDVDTGKTWQLVDRPQNRQAHADGSVTLRYRVNCRASADVVLGRRWISKHHGQIHYAQGRWWVVDGGSVNTVTVNGERITECGRRSIADGDVLGFGETRLRFETDGGPPTLTQL